MKQVNNIALILGVLVMSFALSYLAVAWTEPGQAPPLGNVPAPLNLGITAQSKEGALILATNSAVTTGLIVRYGNVGIGTTGPYAGRNVRLEVIGGTSNTQVVRTRIGTNMGTWRDDAAILNLPWGRLSNQNPDFLMIPTGSYGTSFPIGWSRYNNSGGTTLTGAVVADNTAPNSSGKILRISYDGGGSVSPGFGGFIISQSLKDNEVTAFGQYKRGTRIYFVVWAKIPSDRSIAAASNATGDGGRDDWLTPTAGTGQWERYVRVRTVGQTGTLSSTGHFFVSGGSNVAFDWDVAAGYAIMVDEDYPWDKLSYLNIGYKPNVTLGWGQLLTTQATYLAVDGGNVGIGTTSPAQRLHVAGYARADSGFCIGTNCITGWAAVGMPSGSSGQTLRHDGTTWVANSVLFNDGINVGIGTTAPSYKLDVAGTLRTTGGVVLNTGGAATGLVVQSGNVGIGTTGPASRLHVIGEIRGSTDIRQTDGTNGFILHSRAGTDYDFWQLSPISGGSAEWGKGITLRRDTGNVGVGITSPAEKLQVNGRVRATGFCIDTNCIATWTEVSMPSGSSGQTLRHDGTTWVANSVLFNDGINVGIGTTAPSYKLDVAGTGRFTGVLTLGTQASSAGHAVRADRTITAGNGLTGGGNLTADRTLAVGAGTGITVGATTVGLTYPTKSCASGYAIQAFNLGSVDGPTCVEVGVGAITGSGTAGYVPRWTDSTVLGNSAIQSDGSLVGIGRSPLTYRLWVQGTGDQWSTRFTSGGSYDSNVYLAHGSGYGINVNTGRTDDSTVYIAEFRNASGRAMYIRGDRYVWIDRTLYMPGGNIWLSGGTRYIGTSDSNAFVIRTANTNRVWITSGGNVGIGTTSPGYMLDVASAGSTTARFGTASTDEVIIGGGAGKLTVGTIDPIFEIEGKKYATYVADFSGGTRIETSGTLEFTVDNPHPKIVIDFDNLKEGTDLWLFWQASNKDINDIAVLLTTSFDGKVWYQKNRNILTIYGEGAGEISYRLSAPRVDHQDWSNIVEDQSLEGIKVADY